MHKHNVVVEDENVEDEHSELDHEGHEETNESWRLRLLVIVVQLEQVTIQVLVGHVNDANEEEVQAGGDSIPGDELA